jgi:hypothetical protein
MRTCRFDMLKEEEVAVEEVHSNMEDNREEEEEARSNREAEVDSRVVEERVRSQNK